MRSIQRKHWTLDRIENGRRYVLKIGRKLCPSFTVDEHNSPVINSLVRYFHGDPEFTLPGGIQGDLRKGILLLGRPGTGKTLLMEIFSRYVTIDEMTFMADEKKCPLTFPIIRTERIVAGFSSYGFDDLEPYFRRRIVCFDDLGEERKDSVHFGSRANVMQEILEERYSRSCITLATSNHTVQDFAGMYGSRISSRLFEMMNFLAIHGPDRRLPAYQQELQLTDTK